MTRDSALDNPIDSTSLEMLVDGELDAARKRLLLLELEATSGGWRQCALAFLEAQAWSDDLLGVACDARPAMPPALGSAPVRGGEYRLRQASLLAASVVCAFVAGWIVRSDPAASLPDGRATVDVQRADSYRPVITEPPADAQSVPGTVFEQRDTKIADSEHASPPSSPLTGTLTLHFSHEGQELKVDLPVVDGKYIEVRDLAKLPSVINSGALAELERRGHKVETHRQLVSVNLNDGRRVVLPVDQVDVRFANRVYQ